METEPEKSPKVTIVETVQVQTETLQETPKIEDPLPERVLSSSILPIGEPAPKKPQQETKSETKKSNEYELSESGKKFEEQMISVVNKVKDFYKNLWSSKDKESGNGNPSISHE